MVLRFYRHDDLGHEVNYHTVHLGNALVTDISPQTRTVFLNENESFRHMEAVSLSYQSIRWLDELESREAEDRTRLFDDPDSNLTLAGASTALKPKEDFKVMFVDADSLEIKPNIKARINFPNGKFQDMTSARTGDLILSGVDEGKYTLSGFDGKPSGIHRGNAVALVDVKIPSAKESQSFKPSSGKTSVERHHSAHTHICNIKEYKVKQGDLFSEVAKANGFTFEDLAFFNWGTRDRSTFAEQQLMRFDCGDPASSGDEYILEGGTIYIPEPVTSTGIPTGIRHMAYVRGGGTQKVIHTIKTASGHPVPKVTATLVLDDGSTIEAVSDMDGQAVFNGVPSDLNGKVTYDDEDDLIARNFASDIHALAGDSDTDQLLYLLQSAVDFKAVKTVCQDSYGVDIGKEIQDAFKGDKAEAAIDFFLAETGLVYSGSTEPSFTIKAYPDFSCVTPDAVVSYHAEPKDSGKKFPKGTTFRWKCVNDPSTHPDSSRAVVYGPRTQHWKNARWSFPGLHTLVLRVTYPDGIRETSKYIQWVDSATHILGREFNPKNNDSEPGPFHVLAQKETEHNVLLDIAKMMPPPPDKQEDHDKRIEALETYIGHLKYNLDGLHGKEALAVDAMHIDRERSQRTRLRLYLVNTTAENKKPAWTLVDWTNPMFIQTTGVYTGTAPTHTEAVERVVKEWDKDNRYPDGLITYEFQIPNYGVSSSGEFETDGRSFWDETTTFFDYVAIGSAVVAGVATLALPVPGSRVVSASIWTSIFTSTTSATINIAQRHTEGFGNWKDDTFGLSIVGNLFAGAAAWKIGAQVSSAARIGTMTKAALIGQIGTDGLQGILLGEDFIAQYRDAMDDQSLAPSERLSRIMEVLRKAALAGALTYVSVKGTKADIDNLNSGSTRFSRADVENTSTTIDLDEKVASVPVKRGQDTVETVVETEPKRNKFITEKAQTIPKLKHIDGADEFLQKKFANPKEGYEYIRNLENDVNVIFNKNINGISGTESELLKKNIREGLPIEDYPDVDFDKVDDAIDTISSQTISKQNLSDVKDYIFNNKDFKPPYKMKDNEFFHGFEKNIESWRKLYKGQLDEEATTFIKHELSEMKIKKAIKYDSYSGQFDKILVHEDVHESVLTLFNTQR